MARNEALEAAILAADHDPQTYLVYADWLQSQNDPRGELAVLQHRGSEEATAFLDKHREYFLGRFASSHPETFELEWRCGFIRSATIGWEMFSQPDEDDPADAQLQAFLELDSARFIEQLHLGPVGGEEELDNGILANAIEAVRPASLRKLVLGDIGDWDISSTHTRIPRSESIQQLRELVLIGGDIGVDDSEIDLPALRSFTAQSGSLSELDLRRIAAARWPELESLEIWFGDPNYGASGSVDDIRPILEGRNLTKLRSLGLRNCPFADELVRALVSAPILRQLTSLDLSMGNLSDAGVTAMLAGKDAFAHLATLDLHDNALTNASWPAARPLAKEVVFGVRHTPERAVPRTDGNHYRRFVSVGE